MGVGLIILVLMLVFGIPATSFAMVKDGFNERALAIGMIGFLCALTAMFGIGTAVGKQRTYYDFGCKQSPTIVVNRIEYRCTP